MARSPPRHLIDPLLMDVFRPEAQRVSDPAFRRCACTKAKSVSNAAVLPVIDLSAQISQHRRSPFHSRGRCDAIGVTDGDERRRFGRRDIRMTRVEKYERRGFRRLRTAKARGTIGPDTSGHPRPRRAAPERIVIRRDAERRGIPEDKRERGGEILCGNRPPASGAVLEHECVVATLIDLDCVWEPLVQGGYVREPAARRDDGERSTRLASEEKQSGVPQGWFRLPLRVGIDVVKNGLPPVTSSISRLSDDTTTAGSTCV